MLLLFFLFLILGNKCNFKENIKWEDFLLKKELIYKSYTCGFFILGKLSRNNRFIIFERLETVQL